MEMKGFAAYAKKPATLERLEQLAKAGAVNSRTLNWLEQYVDCVHWKNSGNGPVPAPNVTCAPALVSQTQQVFAISAPSFAVTAEANWDLHIQLFPEMNAFLGQQFGAAYNNWFGGPTGTTFPLGGIVGTSCLSSYAPANGLGAFRVIDNTNYATSFQFAIQQPQTQMEGRLVSMCIKYENSTAKLYDSGMIHGYRLPPCDETSPQNFSVANGNLGSSTTWNQYAYFQRKPWPQFLNQISLVPQYMNHKVTDGAFMTVMIDPKVLPSIPNYTMPMWYTNNFANPYTSPVIAPALTASTGAIPTNGASVVPQTHTGAVPCGLYLQGLNFNHTGTLTITYVWECFPSESLSSENTYVSLLSEGTPYDSIIEEIATCIIAKAPVMGLARDNEFWTWLGKTFGAVGPEISKIIRMIPHPAAQIAGTAVDLASNAIGTRSEKKIRKRAAAKAAKPPPLPARTAANYAMVRNANPPRPPPLPARSAANGYNGTVVPRGKKARRRVLQRVDRF